MSLRGLFADLLLNTACRISTGSGAPESSVTAGIGSIYLRTTAGVGLTLYAKESGTGNTGWMEVGAIKPYRVTLTDAQIKALPTTGITLVSAPGSGFIVRPVVVSLRSSFAAGAYTNVNAAADLTALLGAQYVMSALANDAAITNAGAGTTILTSFLGASAQYTQLVPFNHTENVNEWGELAVRRTLSDVENQALTIKIDNAGSGNLTGGNAANVLKCTTYAAIEAT